MNAEELKYKLKEMFGEQIVFNKEFDYYTEAIKNIDTHLIPWCTLIKEKKLKPISKSILKKNVVFIKKIGSSNRCIIIKIRNGEFTEVHLADHMYYNKLTKKLGLKKSSNLY
jgi:hypothetical protein